MSEIRTRIAPSPSGFLHVGTARTAIINWLYARNKGGKFILRIEDTDADRSSKEMVDAICESLKWLGLDWDEGPYFQSERSELYQEYIEKLLTSGNAYRCFCTPDELKVKREEARKNKTDYKYDRTCLKLSEEDIQKKIDAGEKYVIRVKVPEGEVRFDDMVYGKMVRQGKDIEDFVVCRNNGRPLYNFVVVIDDYEMRITDILRGNDHQTNSFKQILIYNALGLPVPRMGHLPLIFDERKKKISKRDKAANASDYANEGFLPEAVVNYLSMLGWSPKDDREIFTIDELIDVFDIKNANKSNAVFDVVKMKHFNSEHIKKKSNHEIATMIAPMIIQAGVYSKYGLETRWKYFMDVVELLKDRAGVLSDFIERGEYFFQAPHTYEEKGVKKQFNAENAERLEELANRYEKLSRFTHDPLYEALKEMAAEIDVKAGILIHPTRLAVTGMTTGPGLFELLELIGKEEVISRMRTAVIYIREKVINE
ncbi:MAG: glutamate--tRNA ligase [candidate division Zixibacteria bacterium]|nr:glutamate--tRNA ligase [candidate division Zixibacteria bacterium]